MKGDDNFRTLTKSMMLCSNEVHVYKEIIPFFKKYLKENNVTLFNPDEWWTPKVYLADSGIFPELSDCKETIVALENLKVSGYRMGPKIDLDELHLKLMLKNIAYYHSMSFALRITKNPKLEELAEKLVQFSYLSDTREELEMYKRLITVGMERLFTLVETDPKYQFNDKFVADVKRFKEKCFNKPMKLMESFLKRDETFSIITHGDYVRNNVLFKYPGTEGFDEPIGIKMYDFQEIRYATPVVDISFFMYMNIHHTKRDELWDNLILYYHECLMESLTNILKCDKDDERLKPYNLDNFLVHFAKNAFYGVPICLHYVPWIACPEDECAQVAYWFETDMNGQEFHKITQTCGGQQVDERIVSIVKHASEKGYMDIF